MNQRKIELMRAMGRILYKSIDLQMIHSTLNGCLFTGQQMVPIDVHIGTRNSKKKNMTKILEEETCISNLINLKNCFWVLENLL